MANLELKRFLEDVESRIDAAQEERLEREWLDFCELKCADPFFSPRRTPVPSSLEWPKVVINQAFDDMDLMLYLQLKGVSDTLAGESGLLLSARANYGTGIIPTMFGAELFRLKDEVDTLPGTRPLADGVEALQVIADERKIDYTRGLAPLVFEFGRRWKELTKDYPLITRYVYLYNPDLQGPFPLVDMLAGADIYYAFYDEPELVHQALDHMTNVYLDFTAKWQEMFPAYDAEHSIEWGLMHKGRTILRNDAVMNLSEALYREFVMPYDQRVFKAIGGGMHFCGRGDHYIGVACEMEGLSCINLSQPEWNDMEKIYAASIDQGKIIIGLDSSEVLRAGKAGRNLRGMVQSGVALSAYRTGKE